MTSWCELHILAVGTFAVARRKWSLSLEPSSLSQIAVIQTPFDLGVEDALSGLAVIDPFSAHDRTMTLFQFPHSFFPLLTKSSAVLWYFLYWPSDSSSTSTQKKRYWPTTNLCMKVSLNVQGKFNVKCA